MKFVKSLEVHPVDLTATYLCPRCGLTIREFDICDYSKYYSDRVICENCLKDEILRDSAGRNQPDISRWFVSTNKKMSYMFDE